MVRVAGKDDLEQFLAAAERLRREWCDTPERARAFLVHEGIINPDGGLTENYGGERTAPACERQAFLAPFGLKLLDE